MMFIALIGEYKYSTLGEVAHFVLVFNIASVVVCSGNILLFKMKLSEGLNPMKNYQKMSHFTCIHCSFIPRFLFKGLGVSKIFF